MNNSHLRRCTPPTAATAAALGGSGGATSPRWAALACALLVACGSEPGGGGAIDIGGSVDAGADVAVDAAVDPDTGGAADSADTTGGADSVDAGGPADAADTADVATAGPSFTQVWKDVFVARGCNGAYCHGALWPNQAKAHKQLLVGKLNDKACTAASFVVVGKPEQSLLWLKLDAAATHGCGKKMPLGEAGVTAAQSALVKDWILAGAPE